jgi:predicted TIM-barrel fold metal-dependent hydrolase
MPGTRRTGTPARAELEPVAKVARRHPGARVIIAHCGHPASQAALRLVAGHEHVYADLTPVIHRPVRPAAAQLTALAGKLLFGSDAPNTGLTVTQLLDGLAGPDLPQQAWAALTGGTARHLIGDVRA